MKGKMDNKLWLLIFGECDYTTKFIIFSSMKELLENLFRVKHWENGRWLWPGLGDGVRPWGSPPQAGTKPRCDDIYVLTRADQITHLPNQGEGLGFYFLYLPRALKTHEALGSCRSGCFLKHQGQPTKRPWGELGALFREVTCKPGQPMALFPVLCTRSPTQDYFEELHLLL